MDEGCAEDEREEKGEEVAQVHGTWWVGRGKWGLVGGGWRFGLWRGGGVSFLDGVDEFLGVRDHLAVGVGGDELVESFDGAVEAFHFHEAASVVVEDEVDELAVLVLLEGFFVDVHGAGEVLFAVVVFGHFGEGVAGLVCGGELFETGLEGEERFVVVGFVFCVVAEFFEAFADGVLSGGGEGRVFEGGESAIDADGFLELALFLADLAHEHEGVIDEGAFGEAALEF